MKKLPDKPSLLVKTSLQSLEKCEKSKDYEINMGVWHLPPSPRRGSSGPTRVDLSGCVMAQVLSANRHLAAHPKGYPEASNDNKLFALDFLKEGRVLEFFEFMDLPIPEGIKSTIKTSYHKSPAKFKRELKAQINEFERHGI